MKINKKELLSVLKADLRAADELKRAIDQKVEERRDAYSGKLYGNEEEGKSKVVPKVVKRQSEWAHASIKDPFVSTSDIVKCVPITYEDVKAARQNELLLNFQFCRQFDRYKFMTKAIKVLDVDATLVVQTGWEYEDEKVEVDAEVVKVDEYGVEYIDIEVVEETRIKKNRPTAKVCRSEDIFIDPTCQDDLDNAQFVIYRYETDLSTLKRDGRYKNLDKITESEGNDIDYDAEDETEFKFTDKPRQKLVVYEYWGNYDIDDDGIVEPIVCAWIGNTIIRLQTNPYPDKKPPFIVVPFTSVPFQIHGENNIDLISDQQKIITAVTRGIINNMAQSTNGQVGIRKGALDAIQRKKFFKGQNFEFNGSPADFWQGSYNQIPGSAFDMIGLMNNEIESLTGIKGFSQGMSGNSLGNMLDITTNIPMADGSNKKLADIVDGDSIVGSDGRSTVVTKAHEVKLPKKAYSITFSNGDTINSGGEHLWTVKVDTASKKGLWHTVDTDTMFEYYNKFYAEGRSSKKPRGVYIPRIARVHTGTGWGLSIDPYLLGYWLGDGNTNLGKITTADPEIVEYYKAKGFDVVKYADTGKAGMYYINKGTSEMSFTAQLVEAGLSSRKETIRKFIPDEVFKAGYEYKLEVIRGLVDSDGFIAGIRGKTGFAQICQSEGVLKDDIVRLLKSMGADLSIQSVPADVQNARKRNSVLNGARDIISRKTTYKIGFSLPDCPARLPRKADRWVAPKFTGSYSIKEMVETELVPMRCLTVDSADKLYACGHNWTLTHNTATGVRTVMDATSTRRLDLVRNIAENLIKPLMRKWMAYNSEFLSEEEIVRVTNEEFVPIRRDDLDGKVDLDIAISTAEDNAAKVQELSFLLQTLGPSEDPQIRRAIMADIYELSRMPEQAKKIRDFQPQPDPMQVQIQQLEMAKLQAEIQKLQAEAAGLYASAQEDEADKAEKMAQAAVKNAQARKLNSEADNLDFDFVAKDEGFAKQDEMEKAQLKHEQDMQKKEFERLSKLDELAFQAKYGGKNEQLGVSK